MSHNYKIRCGKCDRVENRNDNKVPAEVAIVMQGSCLACTPESIMTSYYYLDANGDRVGQDAAGSGRLTDEVTK